MLIELSKWCWLKLNLKVRSKKLLGHNLPRGCQKKIKSQVPIAIGRIRKIPCINKGIYSNDQLQPDKSRIFYVTLFSNAIQIEVLHKTNSYISIKLKLLTLPFIYKKCQTQSITYLLQSTNRY